MTIVLLPNAGFLSETTRMLAVFRELEKLGVPAVIASHGGPYEELLDQEGVPWRKIPPAQTPEDCRRFLEVLYNPMQGYLYSRGQLREMVENEIGFFKAVDAGAVLSGFTLSAAVSARALGIPLVVTHLASWIPPVLERGRFGIAEHFESSFPLSLLPGRLQARLMAWLFPRVRKHTRVFREIAREVGAEPVRGLFDLMLGDLVLVTDVPEILGISEDELEAWEPSCSCYQPGIRFEFAGAIYARAFGSVPEEVTRFLESDKPTVYVALSSTRPEFLQSVLDTLATLDVRGVIVTTLHRQAVEARGDVLLYDFLPSHEVMPLCDAAVIHGGQGTVQTAIASGTPFVGIPLQPEQNVNLKIVENHGASRTISVKALRSGGLQDPLTEILEDPSFRTAMGRLRELQSRRDGPAETAKRLARFIRTEHPERKAPWE